jgi:hypothetical protein
MLYIVKCRECGNRSIVDINTPEDKRCGVCGAGPDSIILVDKVQDVLPSPKEIAAGLNFKL